MNYHQAFSIDYQYPVVFTRSVFDPSSDVLESILPRDGARILFYADSGVIERWPDLPETIDEWVRKHDERVELVAPLQVVPGGEKIKNDISILDTVGECCRHVGLDRHSYIGIIGGGAVLDAVGFAASTIHRGVRQIRFPTTTMSQGDSGVGVKNGLNRFGIKNYYGTFQPPEAVVCDTDFLRTLSDRDWLSGVAEAFKVAITQDADFYALLVDRAPTISDRDSGVMEDVVRQSARLHLDHIRHSRDPFERGSERPLDFGHWVAHWLEETTDYRMRHGEAVAIGITVDVCCASSLGLLELSQRDQIMEAMKQCGLLLWNEALARRDEDGRLEVLEGMERFRQHLGGELTLVMPDGLGSMVHINELAAPVVTEAVEYLRRECS